MGLPGGDAPTVLWGSGPGASPGLPLRRVCAVPGVRHKRDGFPRGQVCAGGKAVSVCASVCVYVCVHALFLLTQTSIISGPDRPCWILWVGV